MKHYISQNPKTNLYRLTITKQDPIQNDVEIVVGDFFEITLNEVKNWLTVVRRNELV